MSQLNKTLDDAIRTYLGGNDDSGAIQVGMRTERLSQRFGALAITLEPQVEQVLKTAFARVRERDDADPRTIYSLIADTNPGLSHVTCLKIESDIIFQLEH